MDIFVLGRRAAQWLSEQLLGPRGTRAEPVAPRLWRGPGNIDCDQATCQWRCSDNGAGGYAWVLELSCPTACSCPQPAIVCDSSNVDSAYLAECAATSATTTTSVNCSNELCTRRCQDDGTGNYAWVVETDCPTSCDCPLPGTLCDATNFGEERQLVCIGPGTQGCVWLCQGGSYRLSQIGCPYTDCCCNPPSVPCDSASTGHYVVLSCNCPTSTTQPRCENYCTWVCLWSQQDTAYVWTLVGDNPCNAASNCICDPPSPRACSVPGEDTMTPCYRPESTSSTTSTTSSADQCAQHTCKWQCWNQDGQFYWQRIESCPQECSCNNGQAPPSEDCVCATVGQVRVFTCEMVDNCRNTQCMVRCVTDGAGNYYWEIGIPCPTGCECPAGVEGCDSWRLGSIMFLACVRDTTTTTSSTTTTDTTTDTTTTDSTTTGCSQYTCAYSCWPDGTGGYAWMLVSDCPTSCVCPLPTPEYVCDANHANSEVQFACQTT